MYMFISVDWGKVSLTGLLISVADCDNKLNDSLTVMRTTDMPLAVSKVVCGIWIYGKSTGFVRFEVSTAVTMMIIISQNMIIIYRI
jgi:hypothetical protein